ncbi:MAG TPA: MFS transporter, partial [Stenomitos sp.]
RLFKRRAFASTTGSSLLSFCARAGSFFLMPFFLQRVQGYGPAAVGFMLTSFPIAVSLVAPISGTLSDRLGTRGLTVAGQVVAALALGLMASLDAHTPLVLVLLPQVMLGMGTALFTPPNNSAMLSAVDPEDLGMASGMLAVMRNLGLMLGTGFVSLVLALRPADFMGGFRLALASSCLIALLSAWVASVRAKGQAVAVPTASRG